MWKAKTPSSCSRVSTTAWFHEYDTDEVLGWKDRWESHKAAGCSIEQILETALYKTAQRIKERRKDMIGTVGEVRTNSWKVFFWAVLHVVTSMLSRQQKLTFIWKWGFWLLSRRINNNDDLYKQLAKECKRIPCSQYAFLVRRIMLCKTKWCNIIETAIIL